MLQTTSSKWAATVLKPQMTARVGKPDHPHWRRLSILTSEMRIFGDCSVAGACQRTACCVVAGCVLHSRLAVTPLPAHWLPHPRNAAGCVLRSRLAVTRLPAHWLPYPRNAAGCLLRSRLPVTRGRRAPCQSAAACRAPPAAWKSWTPTPAQAAADPIRRMDEMMERLPCTKQLGLALVPAAY